MSDQPDAILTIDELATCLKTGKRVAFIKQYQMREKQLVPGQALGLNRSSKEAWGRWSSTIG